MAAMGDILFKNISGWEKWKRSESQPYLNTPLVSTLHPVPWNAFPPQYLPSDKFWVQSTRVNMCIMTPWTSSTTRAIGLAGYLADLQNVSQFLYVPETLGYCVGDRYREYLYSHLQANRLNPSPDFSFPTDIYFLTDIFERSKLKRIYIQHGEIQNYRKETSLGIDKFFISIGMEGQVPSGVLSSFIASGSITITRKDPLPSSSSSRIITATIMGLSENWEIQISDPGTEPNSSGEMAPILIKSGDFYVFDSVWCIEDPLLIAGIWRGNEDETTPYSDGYVNSGLHLHRTDNSTPYDEIKIMGIYVWKNSVGGVSEASIESSLNNVEGGNWCWHGFSNTAAEAVNSYIYNDDPIRWRVVYIEGVGETDGTTTTTTTTTIAASPPVSSTPVVVANTVTISTLVEMPMASATDIAAWKALPNIDFIRIELADGGRGRKNNWHAPILTKCWVKQGDKYFNILGQQNGCVIDVALRDVSNSISFNTDEWQSVSIFNQYAWMWNDFFLGKAGWGFSSMFFGQVSSRVFNPVTGETTLVISERETTKALFDYDNTDIFTTEQAVTQDSPSKYNPPYLIADGAARPINNFYNRMRCDPTSPVFFNPSMKRVYKKFQNWKYIDINTKNEYLIKTIAFSAFPTEPTTVYNMIIVVSGNAPDTSIIYSNSGGVITTSIVASTGCISFDDSYQADWGFNVGIYQAQGNDVISPDLISVEGNWCSSPIQVSVEEGTLIGICGGRYWGMQPYGCDYIISDNGAFFVVTVPLTGVMCLSSLYNYLNQEEYVFYKDVYSKKINIRKGLLGFREAPEKFEVVIGKKSKSEIVLGSSPYALDRLEERVSSITLKLPTDATNRGKSLMFTTGIVEDFYGSLVSGDGAVDLQTLRKAGIAPGTIPSSTYLSKGHTCSPVYIYERGIGSKFSEYTTLNMGISTTESPISVVGTTTTNAVITYCKDKQTIEKNGYYNCFRMKDGEIILCYGNDVGVFNVNGKVNNSNVASDDNRWDSQNGVFVIGSGLEGNEWGCPLVKSLNYPARAWSAVTTPSPLPTGATLPTDDDFQYPLMILPACDYMGSVFHDNGEKLFIFALCHATKLVSFLGCLMVNVNTLLYRLYKCTNYLSRDLDFLFRPLSIDPAIITDSTKSYSTAEVVRDLPRETQFTQHDSFNRIMGALSTNSQITSIGLPSIVSPFIGPDGVLGVLYDSSEGIKMMFSRDGMIFKDCPTIIARNAHSPTYITEDMIAYITDSGIEVKPFINMQLYAAMQLAEMSPTAGTFIAFKESIQRSFDESSTYLIGSGFVNTQSFNGYMAADGVYRIFYYNSSDELVCSQSEDLVTWKIAPNF